MNVEHAYPSPVRALYLLYHGKAFRPRCHPGKDLSPLWLGDQRHLGPKYETR